MRAGAGDNAGPFRLSAGRGILRPRRALSSAVERFVYTEDAGGSNPSAPTIRIRAAFGAALAVAVRGRARTLTRGCGGTRRPGSGKCVDRGGYGPRQRLRRPRYRLPGPRRTKFRLPAAEGGRPPEWVPRGSQAAAPRR